MLLLWSVWRLQTFSQGSALALSWWLLRVASSPALQLRCVWVTHLESSETQDKPDVLLVTPAPLWTSDSVSVPKGWAPAGAIPPFLLLMLCCWASTVAGNGSWLGTGIQGEKGSFRFHQTSETLLASEQA